MDKEQRINRVLAGLSHTGYTTEIERCEARILIEELEQQVKKQKEVIDKITSNIQNDIDGFVTINDHRECNDILELLQIYLDILKEVSK